MALNLIVYEVFAQVPSGWRSLGLFYTKKEAKERAKKESFRATTIEKKLI